MHTDGQVVTRRAWRVDQQAQEPRSTVTLGRRVGRTPSAFVPGTQGSAFLLFSATQLVTTCHDLCF